MLTSTSFQGYLFILHLVLLIIQHCFVFIFYLVTSFHLHPEEPLIILSSSYCCCELHDIITFLICTIQKGQYL